MLGGSQTRLRTVLLVVLLMVVFTACEIKIELVTSIEGDGSGEFSLRFVVDKELADLARNAGEDPFESLTCPEQLTRTGWVCERSMPGNGLVISLTRAFADAGELNAAMSELEREAAAQEGPTAQFFTLRVSQVAGFLRTTTAIEGSVDLTPTGVLGNAAPETRQALEAIVAQAAGEFFGFDLVAELPGGVSATTGDPESIEGGTVTWKPRLGRTLSFRAQSSVYNTGSLALAGAPALALVLLGAWALIRRGRRSARPGIGDPPAEPPPAV